MGAISEKLVYLNGTKQAIKQAINEDFEVIDNNTTFREYADEISSNNTKYKDLIPKETTNATNTLDISNSSGLDKALVTQYGNTKQSILPSEYTQVDYIRSTGGQYIDTGINADTKLRTILDIAFINPTSANQTMGAINIGTPNKRYHLLSAPNSIAFWVNDTSYNIIRNSDTNRHLWDLNVPEGKVVLDNTTTTTIATNIDDVERNFWLFGRNSNATQYKAPFKLWVCKMYYNGTLVRDFIPCYRNSDNEVGLYDLVNDVFYTNQGTESFTYGSKTPTPDTPQEIVNISGKSNVKVVGKNLWDENYSNMSSDINLTYKPIYVGEGIFTMSSNIPLTTENGFANLFFLSGNVSTGASTGENSVYVDKPISKESIDGYVTIAYRNYLNENPSHYKAQIEKGTASSDYEPYQEQSFDSDLKSKNLFDIQQYLKQNDRGITPIYNQNSSITLSGTATASYSNFTENVPGVLEKDKTYTLSVTGTKNFSIGCRVSYNDNTYDDFNITSSGTYIKITPTKDVSGFRIYMYSLTSGTSYNATLFFQLEESSTPTEYEPFYDINLCKIGNYKDRIYPLNGKWYLEKKIGKVVLNGSENWAKGASRPFYTLLINDILRLQSAGNNATLFCNYLSPSTPATIWGNNINGITNLDDGNAIRIRIQDNPYTITTFKEWLNDVKPVVYYVLATPTTEEITESNYPTLYNQLNNIKLFEGVNHITMTNESGLDVEFDIEYYKDWKLD